MARFSPNRKTVLLYPTQHKSVIDLVSTNDRALLVNVNGIGGVGKTEFLKSLSAEMPSSVYVDLQLDVDRLPEIALLQLRRQWADIGISTPRFDLTIASYWQRTQPNMALNLAADSKLRSGPLVDLATAGGDAAAGMPFFSLAFALSSMALSSRAALRKWRWLASDEVLKELASDKTSASDLMSALPYLLIKDLQTRENGDEPAIIIADGLDSVTGQTHGLPWWLADLLEHAYNCRLPLAVVGASREPVVEVHGAHFVRIHLTGLSNQEALEFLANTHVSPDRAAAIAAESDGLPLVLSSLAQLANTGEFDTDEVKQRGLRSAAERILSHLDSTRVLDDLPYLALASFVDPRIWKELVDLGAVRIGSWGMTSLSFFKSDQAGTRVRVHDLIREYLQATLPTVARSIITERLQEAFRRAADTEGYSNPEYILEAWRLRLQMEDQEAFSQDLEAGTEIRRFAGAMIRSGQFSYLARFAEILRSHGDLRWPSQGPQVAQVLDAIVHFYLGQIEQAHGLLEQQSAEARSRKSFGETWLYLAHCRRVLGSTSSALELYRTVRDESTYTNGVRAEASIWCADLETVQAHIQAAERSLSLATAFADSDDLSATRQHSLMCDVLRMNAQLLRTIGEPKQAMELFETAQGRLFAANYGRGTKFAELETNIAECLVLIDPSAGLVRAQRALQLNETVGNPVEQGKALTAMAQAELLLSKIEDALHHAQRAIEVLESCRYMTGRARALLVLAACLWRMHHVEPAHAALRDAVRSLAEARAYPGLVVAAQAVTDATGAPAASLGGSIVDFGTLPEAAQAKINDFWRRFFGLE